MYCCHCVEGFRDRKFQGIIRIHRKRPGWTWKPLLTSRASQQSKLILFVQDSYIYNDVYRRRTSYAVLWTMERLILLWFLASFTAVALRLCRFLHPFIWFVKTWHSCLNHVSATDKPTAITLLYFYLFVICIIAIHSWWCTCIRRGLTVLTVSLTAC